MKLASLKGGRDGRLVVVSRDLTRCADATVVAPTPFLAPATTTIGTCPAAAFDSTMVAFDNRRNFSA